MKPFNLDECLAGKPVITRDGRTVKIAGYNEDAKESAQIVGWVKGVNFNWYKTGKYMRVDDSDADLFMAPTERKEWIVRGVNGNVVLGPYKVKSDAESCYLVDQGATIHEITIID
jgi:hypothetical protein